MPSSRSDAGPHPRARRLVSQRSLAGPQAHASAWKWTFRLSAPPNPGPPRHGLCAVGWESLNHDDGTAAAVFDAVVARPIAQHANDAPDQHAGDRPAQIVVPRELVLAEPSSRWTSADGAAQIFPRVGSTMDRGQGSMVVSPLRQTRKHRGRIGGNLMAAPGPKFALRSSNFEVSFEVPGVGVEPTQAVRPSGF